MEKVLENYGPDSQVPNCRRGGGTNKEGGWHFLKKP